MLKSAPVGNELAPQNVPLTAAQADFEQMGNEASKAIDGDLKTGWGVKPQFGKAHAAVFETLNDIGAVGGSVLTITLSQQMGTQHTIGKFRISVTNSPIVGLGLPANISDIAKVAPDQRNEEQKKALADYFKSKDVDLVRLQGELAQAQQPRAEDPQLVDLRMKLDEAKLPLPEDPKLVRLRRSVQLSEEQLKNERLTAAQDLAWALINSPAFLFNR